MTDTKKPEVTPEDVMESIAGMVGVRLFYEKNRASSGALELLDKISRCLRELDKRETLTEYVEFQLEQKMGDGSWSRVYQDKHEADYETPVYVCFPSKEAAQSYANGGGNGKWSKDALARGIVRVLVLRTTISVAE